MLNSKEIILSNVESIFKEYNKIKEEKNESLLKQINDTNELRECNKKLMGEVSEKDKLLLVNERKMIDYEDMINQIQENAMKEKTEKERFDMLKKQDKEIYERDIEIQRLQKKVDMLTDKLSLLDKKSDVNDNIAEVRDEEKGGDTLVQKMKEIQEKQKDDEEEDEEEETKVVDNPEEEEVETKVVDNPEEVETPVIDNPNDKDEDEGIDDGEETEELSEEEDAEVEILNYYKKDYYLVVNESPQGIYMIENGELGDKVGEVNDGKKVFYKSSKK